MAFGAVAAMTVTGAVLGVERTQEEPAVLVVATPKATTAVPPPTVVTTTDEPIPTPAPTTEATRAKPGGLVEFAEGIDLGVVMRDLHTGEDLFAHNADQPFDSASLVKILIALDGLTAKRYPPDEVVRMLATSDDDAASRMWSDAGGSRIVAMWAKRVGMTGTTPPEDPNRWGDTQTTAADLALLYAYLLEDPVGPVVLEGLGQMSDFGVDGFDQRFGVPAAAGDRQWAVKQGWACCRNGRILHSTGLVGPDNRYVVVVLTGQPATTSVAAARSKVTQIAAFLLNEH